MKKIHAVLISVLLGNSTYAEANTDAGCKTTGVSNYKMSGGGEMICIFKTCLGGIKVARCTPPVDKKKNKEKTEGVTPSTEQIKLKNLV